jgi:hypothetical protein
MAYNHGDVKCPHCNEVVRIAVKREEPPFGSVSFENTKNYCGNCRNDFMGVANVVYSARKLTAWELKHITK